MARRNMFPARKPVRLVALVAAVVGQTLPSPGSPRGVSARLSHGRTSRRGAVAALILGPREPNVMVALMFEIYGYLKDPFAWCVRFAAEEKGIEYQWIPSDVAYPDPRAGAACGQGAPDRPLPNVWLGVSVENQRYADIAASIQRVTEDYLQFARLPKPQREPISLNHVVLEALKLLRASLPTTIRIQTELTKTPAVLYDIHHPKGHHRHRGARQGASPFSGVDQLLADFLADGRRATAERKGEEHERPD